MVDAHATTPPVCVQVDRRFKHNHCSNGSSPTYVSWRAMWVRCKWRKNSNYYHYGGAGITVCDRWKSFEFFLADMGERPNGCTLDRIDGTQNYTPENCRWATPKQQMRNRKDNRLITHDGQTLCLAEWNERLKMGKDTLGQRLRRGWSVHRAITEPVRRRPGDSPNAVKEPGQVVGDFDERLGEILGEDYCEPGNDGR